LYSPQDRCNNISSSSLAVSEKERDAGERKKGAESWGWKERTKEDGNLKSILVLWHRSLLASIPDSTLKR
jgi:hypothetical protein